MFVVVEGTNPHAVVELCAKLMLHFQPSARSHYKVEWMPRTDVVVCDAPLISSAARRYMEFVQMHEFDARTAIKARTNSDGILIVSRLYYTPNLHFPLGVPMPDLILYIEDASTPPPDVKCSTFCKFVEKFGIRHAKRIRLADPDALTKVAISYVCSVMG